MIDEEQPKDILSMINMAMQSTDDHKRFFKFCYMIFTAQKKDSWVAEAESILRDSSFMKKVGFLSAIKENSELRTAYYGHDKGVFDPLIYREDDEREIVDVELRFLRYLGIIMKELQEDVSFEI